MSAKFEHRALHLTQAKPLVYTAMSKHLFYFRLHISKFVLEQGGVPLNPFTSFDYFMLDTVDRDLVRQANNNLVMRSDEIWVFGAISDGVLAEMKIAQQRGKPVKFFKIEHARTIVACQQTELTLEEDVATHSISV